MPPSQRTNVVQRLSNPKWVLFEKPLGETARDYIELERQIKLKDFSGTVNYNLINIRSIKKLRLKKLQSLRISLSSELPEVKNTFEHLVHFFYLTEYLLRETIVKLERKDNEKVIIYCCTLSSGILVDWELRKGPASWSLSGESEKLILHFNIRNLKLSIIPKENNMISGFRFSCVEFYENILQYSSAIAEKMLTSGYSYGTIYSFIHGVVCRNDLQLIIKREKRWLEMLEKSHGY